MGIPSWDDIVVIEHAKNSDDPTVITVNCPDKTGLGCDIVRIILEFGLYVTRAGQHLFYFCSILFFNLFCFFCFFYFIGLDIGCFGIIMLKASPNWFFRFCL